MGYLLGGLKVEFGPVDSIEIIVKANGEAVIASEWTDGRTTSFKADSFVAPAGACYRETEVTVLKNQLEKCRKEGKQS